MQWEYACLVRNTFREYAGTGSWVTSYTFHSPDGQKEVTGDNGIELLNDLGQQGWELVTVETGYLDNMIERSYWLKRPLRNR